MARNGSGQYTLPPVYEAVPNTTIKAAQHNTPMVDIQAALTGSVASDGQTPMTGNLQMGAKKITDMAVGTAATDAVRFDQVSPVLAVIGKVFDAVTAMKANASIAAGESVGTLGYYAKFDGGDASYAIKTLADFGGTPDGLVDHMTAGGLVAVLQPAGEMRAECAGVVPVSGLAVECSDRFNAAFWYAQDKGLDFSCYTDFLAKNVLQFTKRNGGTFGDCTLDFACQITAVAGGTFTLGGTLANGTVYGPHSQSRPIPLVYAKPNNVQFTWPRLECQNLCAGVKMPVNTANMHLYPEIRGFSRYAWWPVAGNDSKIVEPLIKQMYRDPAWMTSVGLDPTDYTVWNGDCIIVSTKDYMYDGGQIGWGGPCVRILFSMPTDPAQYVPGQNCYWCGLSPATGYLDGEIGGGDVMFSNLHVMQGIGNTAFLDLGIGPRYGAWMDWDRATNAQVIRTCDSPIGVLSFLKSSNLTYFDRLDNDGCIHLLYGAQVEFTDEAPGSSARVQSLSTEGAYLLDPKIRAFASRSPNGSTRYPFMVSQHHERTMQMGFFTNPAEIYWNGTALVTASTAWDGSYDEWNKLNRASGTYGGQQLFRGTIKAPTTGPSAPLQGNYWIVRGAISFTSGAGTVTAADGQLLWALVNAPAAVTDWLVINADSAPIRATASYEIDARAHQLIVYPGNDEGVPQRRLRTPGSKFSEEWGFTGAPDKVTASWDGVSYRLDSSLSTMSFYLGAASNGFTVNAGFLGMWSGGVKTWEFTNTGTLRPATNNAYTLGSNLQRPSTTYLRDMDLIIPTYATNAAALAGGLTVGLVYKAATGELRIVV